MKFLIFWESFQFYHLGRIIAGKKLAESLGHELISVAICPTSSTFPNQGKYAQINENVIQLSQDFPKCHMQSRKSAFKLIGLLNSENPDVVIIPGYDSKVNLAALGWCRRKGKGAVLMSDSQKRDFPRYIWKEYLKKILLKNFDTAFVAGKAAADYIKHLNMAPDKIFTGCDVVDNCFWEDWSNFVRQDPHFWQKKLGLPDKYFLTVCRLVPTKNIVGLISAYVEYITKVENPWALVIVGSGAQQNKIEQLIKALSLDSKVFLLGQLTPEQVAPVYSLASTFILASSIHETWGLVINEAMASGIPVLVSKICGCVPDLIIEGVTGYTFDPKDDTLIVDLLLQVTLAGDHLYKISSNAQKHIKAFSLDVFAKNLLDSSISAYLRSQDRKINFWPIPLVLPLFGMNRNHRFDESNTIPNSKKG